MASTISTLDPQLRSALESAAEALRELGDMALPAKLDLRMRELGEKREACTSRQHDEYVAWVEFTQQLTLDKLRALNALETLRDAIPDLSLEP